LSFLSDIADLDWVVSVNLLSQLADGAPEGMERRAVDTHLAALATLSCPATLITDVTADVADCSGALVERVDLLHGRSLPRPDAHWQWDIAPFGEDGAATRRVHYVAAYGNWREAGRRA
jgi:hypothetical protein